MSKWLAIAALLGTVGCEQFPSRARPLIHSIFPSQWEVDDPPDGTLTVSGENFFLRVRTDAIGDSVATNDSFRAEAGGESLAPVRWLDNETLEVPVPALAVGLYDLTITMPGGETAKLAHAIRVREPGSNPVSVHHSGPADLDVDEAETTIQIEPVDPNRSILFFTVTHTSNEPGTGLVTGWLADDGRSVTFTRHTTQLFYDENQQADEAVSIRWTVLELEGIYVMRGRWVMSFDLDNYVDLPNPVDLSRSFIIATHELDGTNFAGNDWVRATFSDEDTLRFSFRQSGETSTIAWQVIEIEGGSVESGDAYLTNGSFSTRIDSLPPAALDQSLLLFTMTPHGSGNADAASALVSGRLSSPTEIVFERYVGWSQANVDISWFRIHWPRMHVQHGTMPFDIGEQNKDVLLDTQIDPTSSVGLLAGQMRQSRANQDDDHVGAGWFITELSTDGQRLHLHRAVDDSEAVAEWQVVEFQ